MLLPLSYGSHPIDLASPPTDVHAVVPDPPHILIMLPPHSRAVKKTEPGVSLPLRKGKGELGRTYVVVVALSLDKCWRFVDSGIENVLCQWGAALRFLWIMITCMDCNGSCVDVRRDVRCKQREPSKSMNTWIRGSGRYDTCGSGSCKCSAGCNKVGELHGDN